MSRDISTRPHPVCAQLGCGHLRINHYTNTDGFKVCDVMVSLSSVGDTIAARLGSRLCQCPGFVSISDKPVEGSVSA